MESPISESNNILLFWRPRYVPRIPATSPLTVIVPLVNGWNSLGFPTFNLTIAPTNTVTVQNILGIQFALSSLATGVGKSYLFCRNFFVFLAFLSLAYGIMTVVLDNAGGIIPILMTFFWMGMARLMANKLVVSLGEGEIVMEGKVRDLSRAYLGNELEVKMGRSMQWVGVSVPGYRPPELNVVSGMPIPMGVPV